MKCFSILLVTFTEEGSGNNSRRNWEVLQDMKYKCKD